MTTQKRSLIVFGAVFIAGAIFFLIFLFSLLFLSGHVGDDLSLTVKLVPVFTAIISAGGTVSTAVLAWRVSRRDIKERDLRIERLERDLELIQNAPKGS